MAKHAPGTLANDAFLQAVFRADWSRASVISVPDVEAPGAVWTAHGAGSGVIARFKPEHNNYFAVSLFSRPARRRKEHFEALVALVLDDVGAKVAPDTVRAALGEPLWRLETSPGSEHWGYRLAPRVTDVTRASRLIKRIVIGLCGGVDPGMGGVTRPMRLPVGRNTKSRLGFGGFACRLLAWNDTEVADLDPARVEAALPLPDDDNGDPRAGDPGAGGPGAGDPGGDGGDPVQDLDLDTGPAPSAGAGGGGGSPRAPDPVLRGLLRLGRVKSNTRQMAGGVGWDITCPWVEFHTPSAAVDTGTAYFRGGGFKCWHGHCDTKGPADVRARVDELLRADSGGLVGLDDLDTAGQLSVVDPAQVPASPLAANATPEPDAARLFWERTVYHRGEDRFIDLTSETAMNDRAFNTAWHDDMDAHLPKNDKGRPVTPSVFYRTGSRKRVIDARTWWPGRSRLFIERSDGLEKRLLNTWRDPARPLARVPDTELDQHVRGSEWWALGDDLTGTNTPEERANNRLLRVYQAMVVGGFDVKPGFNPLFIGAQGAGKEHVWAPLIAVLGPTRSLQLAQIEVGDKFTDWFRYKLIMLAEMRRTTRGSVTDHDQYNALKQILDPGKPWLRLNEKYREPVSVLNCFVMVLTSNEDRPVTLAEDDRRFWVTRVQDTAAKGWTPDRHQRMAAWRGSPDPWGAGATNDHAVVEWLIRYWFPDLMLAEVRGSAPMTQDKADLIELSGGSVLAWLIDRFARKAPDPLAMPDLFTAADVVDQCNRAVTQGGEGLSRHTHVPGADTMGYLLARAGCRKLNGGNRIGQRQIRLWRAPRADPVYDMMPGAELAKVYRSP